MTELLGRENPLKLMNLKKKDDDPFYSIAYIFGSFLNIHTIYGDLYGIYSISIDLYQKSSPHCSRPLHTIRCARATIGCSKVQPNG